MSADDPRDYAVDFYDQRTKAGDSGSLVDRTKQDCIKLLTTPSLHISNNELGETHYRIFALFRRGVAVFLFGLFALFAVRDLVLVGIFTCFERQDIIEHHCLHHDEQCQGSCFLRATLFTNGVHHDDPALTKIIIPTLDPAILPAPENFSVSLNLFSFFGGDSSIPIAVFFDDPFQPPRA